MSLTQLESSLFESVEFCLALLGTIPVPICLVKQDRKIVSLNAVKVVENDKLQQVRCAHSEKSASWEFDPDAKCVLCQTIAECKRTKQKTVKKGSWRISVGSTTKDLIIVAHAVYTRIRNEEFVFVAIEDLTEVEKLKGLLPICMMCNKIYDHDSGKWVKIDEYITDRSPAKFSHGVCPDCSKVMMDDIKQLRCMVLPVSQLQQVLGYEIRNEDIFLQAVTHRSYSAENNIPYDNQRLEFLGDSVLEIILTDYLFRRYPDADEGLLTKMRSALVQQDTLANLAKKLSFNDYLLMGKGEIDTKGKLRDSTLADVFEALLGALFLDSGSIETVAGFIIPLIEKNYPDPDEKLIEMNPKGALQEYTQKQWNSSPLYSILEVSGPDHKPSYKVSVTVHGKTIAFGEAPKRKLAESVAAKNALNYLREKGIDFKS